MLKNCATVRKIEKDLHIYSSLVHISESFTVSGTKKAKKKKKEKKKESGQALDGHPSFTKS